MNKLLVTMLALLVSGPLFGMSSATHPINRATESIGFIDLTGGGSTVVKAGETTGTAINKPFLYQDASGQIGPVGGPTITFKSIGEITVSGTAGGSYLIYNGYSSNKISLTPKETTGLGLVSMYPTVIPPKSFGFIRIGDNNWKIILDLQPM